MSEETGKVTGGGQGAEALAPLMPLRDVVILPNSERSLYVGRSKSLVALEKAWTGDRRLVFVTQRDEGNEEPGRDDLYSCGCVAEIVRIYANPEEETRKVLAKGLRRVRIETIRTAGHGDSMQLCSYTELADRDIPSEARFDELLGQLLLAFVPDKNPAVGRLRQLRKMRREDFGGYVDKIAGAPDLPVEVQQAVLEELSVIKRTELLLGYRTKENNVNKLTAELRRQASNMNEGHRLDYLKEKAASIQNALGEGNQEDNEDLRAKVEEAGMSEEARTKCLAEIGRLATITPMSPESSVIRAYVETLLSLPWKERTEVRFDLAGARKVLDADHKGLDKVKERIIEHLAVKQRVGHNRGSVLCFLGPPGVGKTSLGKSIAAATGRRFVRLALGGIHDEATIRGHRRTYVASMPGRILKSMAEAKVVNPVFMLDEIDKLASSYSGDPMAALLEVIDPEQNKQFVDQYAEVEFDLSEVMFIATANASKTMYAALRDRLEIIELPGYTDNEKLAIARQHLVPKSIKANGLRAQPPRFSETALRTIIRDYTKEAGVRNLERCVSKICRKVVLEQEIKSTGKKETAIQRPAVLTKAKVTDMLGPPLVFQALQRRDSVGIVNGLAVMRDWDGIVHQIDAVRVPDADGDGGLVKTGNLMPNIEQSIDAACAVLRGNPGKYGLERDFLDQNQVHIHYPNIDVAHDGNSNGLALFALLVSVLNDIPVRVDTAITGAVNLRGEACAVGGLRAKLVGAWRERVRRVIIPHVQTREIAQLPKDIADELEIIAVRKVDDVLRHILVKMPRPRKNKEGAPEGERLLVARKAVGGRPQSRRH